MKRVISLVAVVILAFLTQPAFADKSYERVVREHYPVTGPVRIEHGHQVHYPRGWTLKKHHYGSYMSPNHHHHRHTIVVRPNKYYGHHGNHKDGLDRAEQAIDIAVKIAVLKEILKD